MPKTILSAVPHQLKGRGHMRCVPMQCKCGCQFLLGLSNGHEDTFADLTQVDVKCPICTDVTAESVEALLDPKNIHDGQAGLPAGVNS